jgi:hypothetical protein
LGVGPVEKDAERLEDFAASAAHVAEPAQARGQSQPGLGTLRIGDSERQRGTDVVELGLEPIQPDGLARTAQVLSELASARGGSPYRYTAPVPDGATRRNDRGDELGGHGCLPERSCAGS